MRKFFIFSVVFLFFVMVSIAQQATTYILVRHAEKSIDGTKNPSLNTAGKRRANFLVKMLSKEKISALYSTPFKRTEETLAPLAKAKELSITYYEPDAKKGWLAGILSKWVGGTVVISGHSNTIPHLANTLLGEQKFSNFDETNYTHFIVIVASEVGKGKLLWLSY